MLNKNMGKTDERNHAEALYENTFLIKNQFLMAQVHLPWSLHCFKNRDSPEIRDLGFVSAIDRYPSDNILAFHQHSDCKERWSGWGRWGQKRGEREKERKKRASEDKLCQDSSQFHGEIKLPYGFAVNRNTICHAVT